MTQAVQAKKASLVSMLTFLEELCTNDFSDEPKFTLTDELHKGLLITRFPRMTEHCSKVEAPRQSARLGIEVKPLIIYIPTAPHI